MEEKIVFISVFVPYHQHHHIACFAYDENEYGQHLPVGTYVCTSMGVGVIIRDDVPESALPQADIYDIFRLADAKESKLIEKDWWKPVLAVHQALSEQEQQTTLR